MREVIHFIIVLMLSIPLMYTLYHSGLPKDKRYRLSLAIFIILHFGGLFFSSSFIGFISVILSLLGIITTYFLWWIHKKSKRLVDLLKLTWAGLFIWTYFMSWHHFQVYCSFCDNYFAGISPPFGPKYLDYLHLTNYLLLLIIAFLVGFYNRTLKHPDNKTKMA